MPRFEIIARYAACIVFGGMMGVYDVAPFPALKWGWEDTKTLILEVRQTRPTILSSPPYTGSGLVTNRPVMTQQGYTMIQGILPGGPQVRLIDMDGQEVHRWVIDYFDIWKDPTHVIPAQNLPKSEFNFHTQGFWPLPDGSIIANISDIGAVRLDMCSNVVWTLDRMAHHSVTKAPDGSFWIPGHISIYETPDELFPNNLTADQIAEKLEGQLNNYNNSIMLVSGDGNITKEFSVLQAISDAGLEHALYASLHENPVDPTHINDIEVVTAALAEKIGNVSQGDLLISLRAMNMLAILDQTDGHLKWYKQGPWVRQHDPDIMADGTIEIFNNRSKSIGAGVVGSQILSYDPSTDVTEVLHPIGANDGFYSSIMGTHQRLENGNLLIAETDAGRAFEVTSEAEVVWDYRLPYDDESASLFEAGMRVPLDYFENENWTCEGD